MSFNHEGRGRFIGGPSLRENHAASCAYRIHAGNTLWNCNCPMGTWEDGQPATPSELQAAVDAAEKIIRQGDNISYPSRASARHVRKVMADLVAAVTHRGIL